jgi:hypothetical protein
LIHLSDEIPGQNADYNMAHDTRSSDLVESFGAGTSHVCSLEIISQQCFSHKKKKPANSTFSQPDQPKRTG